MVAQWEAFAHNGAGTSGDPVVSKPSGTVETNLLVATAVTDSGATATPPGGWTQLVANRLWWKLAGAAEAASYTFVISGALARSNVAIARITGHDLLNPIDDFDTSPEGTGALTIPSVDSLGADRLLLGICCKVNNGAAVTPPAGVTERWDATSGAGWTTAGGDEVVGAGATGTRLWTPTAGGNGIAAMVAIKPAGNSGAGFLALL